MPTNTNPYYRGNPRTTSSASQTNTKPKPKTKNQKVKPSGSSTINPRTTSSASYPARNTTKITNPTSPYAMYPAKSAEDISSGVTAVLNEKDPDKAAPAVAPATNIRAAQVTSKTPTKTIGASTDVDDVQTMNQINAFNASIASLSSNVAKNTATIQQIAAQDQQARNQAQADALNAQYSSAGTVDQTAAPAATPAPTGGISGFLSGTTGKIVVYGGIAAGAFFFARSRGLLK